MKILLLLLLFLSPLHAYEAQYDGLLKAHVKAGERGGITGAFVNYATWKGDNRHEAAIKSLLSQKPSSFNRAEKLAFWINAYNLLTVDVIIKTGETKSIRNQGTLLVNVWQKHKYEIEGKLVSLDDIEHKIIRPMNEPRIHFAIVCASLSCPDLRNSVYRPAQLENQLAEQTKAFLMNETKGVSETGKVSKIFDWFKVDFGGESGAIAFISKVKPVSALSFLPYDWSLNGSW